MRFPPFWHRAALPDEPPPPSPYPIAPPFIGHGWSYESEDDARTQALAKAQRVKNHFVHHTGERPAWAWTYYPADGDIIREVVLERSRDVAPVAWVISRNSYGAHVLNVDGMAIIDVDAPERPSPDVWPEFGLRSMLRRFVGAPQQPPTPADPADAMQPGLIELLDAQTLGGRLYRTAGGFRIVITSEPMRWDDPRLDALMSTTGADPQYVRLCRQQQCCRARLTPKSWRVGVPAPVRVPRPWTAPDHWDPADWSARYDAASVGYVVAREVHRFGSSLVHRDLRDVLDVHERCVGEGRLA